MSQDFLRPMVSLSRMSGIGSPPPTGTSSPCACRLIVRFSLNSGDLCYRRKNVSRVPSSQEFRNRVHYNKSDQGSEKRRFANYSDFASSEGSCDGRRRFSETALLRL